MYRYNIIVHNKLTHTDKQYGQSTILCTNLNNLLSPLLNRNSRIGLNKSDLLKILVTASIRIIVAAICKANNITIPPNKSVPAKAGHAIL